MRNATLYISIGTYECAHLCIEEHLNTYLYICFSKEFLTPELCGGREDIVFSILSSSFSSSMFALLNGTEKKKQKPEFVQLN